MGFEIFGILLIILFAALLIVGTILLMITRNPNNAGAQCNGNSDCTGGSICESSSHTCRIPDGGTCSTNAQCTTGSACATNVCVRVTSSNQINITNGNLSAENVSTRSRAAQNRSVRFNLANETTRAPPKMVKFGRKSNSNTEQNISPFDLHVNTPVSEAERNITTLDGTVEPAGSPKNKFRGPTGNTSNVSENRRRWKAEPQVANSDTWRPRSSSKSRNGWSVYPEEPNWESEPTSDVTSNSWKVPPSRDVTSNTWKAKPVINSNSWKQEPVQNVAFNPRKAQHVQNLMSNPWKAQPVIDPNSWKAQSVTNYWKAQPVTNSNSWKEQATHKDSWKAPVIIKTRENVGISKEETKHVGSDLLDLDFGSNLRSGLEESGYAIDTTKLEPLTQTSKLRSQFVDEIPSLKIEQPLVVGNSRSVQPIPKKMEVVGHFGEIEVPVQYRYEADSEEEEYLFGTFRDSSVRGVTVSSEGRAVLDLCHFSSYVIYLHEGGYATRETINKDNQENSEKVPVKMNIQPTTLVKHRGNLYALQNGRLYTLDISTLTTTLWKWSSCDWSPLNILSMTSTTDGKYIYLQTSEYNILYDSSLKEVTRTSNIGKRRVYGYDLTTYVDIDPNTNSAIYHYGSKQEMLSDIVDAVILHTGKVVSINTAESGTYFRVRLIQWRPWFIKKNIF